MNKKGISARILMVMILVLIVGVILIVFLQKWYETASYEAHKRQCQQSVMLHAASQKIGELSEIKCPVWIETLSGDDENIKRRIADLMTDAWDVFGKGKYELFAQETVYCSIYAVVDFKDKNKRIDGFVDYLTDTTIPFKNVKYIEYLSGRESDKAKSLIPDLEKIKQNAVDVNKIDTSKDYAIIFVYAKGNSFIKDIIERFGSIKASLGAGALAGTGGIIGAVFILGTNPFGWVTTIVGVTAFTFTAIETYFAEGETGWYSAVVFRPYVKEEIEKLGCKEFPVRTVK